MKRNIGIVLAGGIGQRFGGDRPKQYYLIRGKEMIAYSIELFRAAKTIDAYIGLLGEYDFVQTTLKITDALGSYTDRTVDRENYFLIQAPDAYRFGLLRKHFDPDHPNGHPAAQLPDSAKGYNAFASGRVFKVTHPDDIRIVECLMDERTGG